MTTTTTGFDLIVAFARQEAQALAQLTAAGVTIGEPVTLTSTTGHCNCIWHLHDEEGSALDGGSASMIRTNLLTLGYYGTGDQQGPFTLHPVVMDALPPCVSEKGHTFLGEAPGQPCIYCGAARRDTDTETLECLNASEECQGPVEYRMPLSGTGESFPRCDKHWEERLDREQEIRERYPEHQPADFDPSYAGEHWGDDY